MTVSPWERALVILGNHQLLMKYAIANQQVSLL